MDSRRIVFRETGVVLLGEILCLAVMLGIFALLGRFDRAVLLGGIIGTLLAVGNFFIMAVSASVAADKAVENDVKGGASMMRASYIARLAVIFVILLALVKGGLCNPISSVLPLLFVRWVITLAEFFRKKGDA